MSKKNDEMKRARTIAKPAVIGSGFIGWQLGLQFAVHGCPVWLVDLHEAALERAAHEHEMELAKRLTAGQITEDQRGDILQRIHFTTDLAEAAHDVDIAVECVPEQLPVKREVFAELDRVFLPDAILASNSSSIPISAIEDVTQRRDKVLNVHFFHYVWEVPMVELMRGSATSDQTMALARQFAHRIGMTPLLVEKESTGFLFNRVWRAIKREVLNLVDEGIGSYEDIDRAWMIFTGQPIGPFGRMDRVGLDVVRDIAMVYYRKSGSETDAPQKILAEKVEKGELGLKTGKGFYSYPNPAYEDPAWLRGQ